MKLKRNDRRLLPFLLILGGGLLLPATASASGVETEKSLLDLYREGGPVMHIIALCSVVTLALGAYCGIMYRRARMMPATVVAHLGDLVARRDLAAAYEYCRVNPGPLTHALASALTKANYERDMFNKTAMENSIADDCFRSETKMMVVVNYLNTFAVLAPMIGLLGTVSGMITSFSALTAGKAEATDLAKGIGEALIATGGGLLLAIPSMFLYFFFRGQVSTNMADVHKTLSHIHHKREGLRTLITRAFVTLLTYMTVPTIVRKSNDKWHRFTEIIRTARRTGTRAFGARTVGGFGRVPKTRDRKEAQRIAITWERLAEQGRKGHLLAAQARRVVSEMVAEATGESLTFHSASGWLRDWALSKEAAVSPATAARYRQVVEDFLAHLGPGRAQAPLGSVSPRDISAMRDNLRRKGLSARGCNAVKQMLNIPFEAAKRLGFIPFNPCNAVDSLKEANATARREPFTDEEVSRLLSVAQGDWYGAILTGWTTGLRLSDVASLTWSCINLENRTPSGKADPAIRLITSKTQTPLALPILNDLASWLTSQPRGVGKAPLFPSLYGKATGGKYGLSRQFGAIVREAGITHRVTERHGEGRTTVCKSFHSLRHGLVSALANAGIPPDVRKKIVGHSSDKIHAIYSQHTAALLRSALDSLPSVVKRKEAV